MHSIKHLQQLVENKIAETNFNGQPKELYEPLSYILSLGGKRLRPALLLMAVDMFEADVQQFLNQALSIEVFHNFTLMHDDIMDKAPIRRGKATVHKKWNESVAILAGDVMLVEAYKLLMTTETQFLKPVLEVFNETAVGVCEGQQIDMNFEQQTVVAENEYINMIRLKTAVLLGGALKMGALLAGATTENADKLYAFGVNIGIAFQLQDDLLDVYGDPKKFGKKIGGDILSNKKTFLLIKALELEKQHSKADLKNILKEKNFENEQKIKQVTQIYNAHNIADLTHKEINKYAKQAFDCLEKVGVKTKNKEILEAFAGELLMRES